NWAKYVATSLVSVLSWLRPQESKMSETQTTAKRQRTLIGQVVSNKMDKTVVVLVARRVKHPLYGKIIVRSNKYKAHDETNQYNEGDTVEISEGRPISRSNSWTVVPLIEPARVLQALGQTPRLRPGSGRSKTPRSGYRLWFFYARLFVDGHGNKILGSGH